MLRKSSFYAAMGRPASRLPLLLAALSLIFSPACGGGGGDGGGEVCTDLGDCPDYSNVCFLGRCTDPASIKYDSCTGQSECTGATDFCYEGYCVPLAKIPKCTDDATICPQGLQCLDNGRCGVPTDCPDGCAPGQTCKGGVCTGSECGTGDTQACFIGCHKGVKDCQNGIWGSCEAEPVLEDEICDDNLDNNCDGEVDEGCTKCTGTVTKPCESACANGVRECIDGEWGPCSADEDCLCEPGVTGSEPCEFCGIKERTCDELGIWSMWSECTGQGACEAGLDEVTRCGLCGEQTRLCKSDCTWDVWGECIVPEGTCTPGESDTQDCGNCGLKERSCTQECTWTDWGECVEGAGCIKDEVEYMDCGNCGRKMRTCYANCSWGEWGECEDEGECLPDTKETQACGFCGQQERVCGPNCTFPEWDECVGGGACEPGDTETEPCGPSSTDGICELGQRQRGCSNTCQWNPWGSCLGAIYPATEICGDSIDQDCSGQDLTAPDSNEPNNTCVQCTWLGTDPNVTIFGTLDHPGEHDYFCFEAVDNWNLPGFGEHIRVDLTNQPLNIDADLLLFKGLDACNSGPPIATSIQMGGADEHIDWVETSAEENGTFYIKVENWSEIGNCYGNYTLTVNGLN